MDITLFLGHLLFIGGTFIGGMAVGFMFKEKIATKLNYFWNRKR